MALQDFDEGFCVCCRRCRVLRNRFDELVNALRAELSDNVVEGVEDYFARI